MHFLIDMSALEVDESPTESIYLATLFKELALANEEDLYSWIVSDQIKITDLPTNIRIYVKKKRAWPFGQFIERLRLKNALKKNVPDRVLLVNSLQSYNRYTNFNVLITTPDRFIKHNKKGRSADSTNKGLGAAGSIIISFEADAAYIINQFSVLPGKLKVLDLVPLLSRPPLPAEQKEELKARVTNGNEYFIYSGDIGNSARLLLLLKAFSQFKKWQRSAMQLVIAGASTPWTSSLQEAIQSYKYREHVQVILDPSEEALEKLIGAAYCMVDPRMDNHLLLELKKAIALEVPAIVPPTDNIRKLLGNSALYAASGDEMSAAMQTIYKDENLRKNIIEGSKSAPAYAAKSEMSNLLRKFLQ